MKRLRFSSAALRDLNEIWDESKKRWGTQRALAYTSEIVLRSRAAIARPAAFRKVKFHGVTFLRPRSGSHYIFLVEFPDAYQAVRILHTKRDARRHLK